MNRPPLGDQELHVLRYVLEHAPVAVSDVAQHFGDTRGLARTTVLTVMERLRNKGYLTRRKARNRYHYSPRVPESDLLRSLVQGFTRRMAGASLLPVVAYLIEDAALTEAELRELRKLVDELEKKRKGDDHG